MSTAAPFELELFALMLVFPFYTFHQLLDLGLLGK